MGDIQDWALNWATSGQLVPEVELESDGCDGGEGCAGGVGRVGDPDRDLELVERTEQSYIVVDIEITGAARVVELRIPLLPTG